MALIIKDRVKVTTTTTGTGPLTLGSAQFGFQDFSTFSTGDTTYYAVVDNATGAWETGLGTYDSAGPTLTRTSVLASSTGSAVSFGAGPKDVFVVYPAAQAMLKADNLAGLANTGAARTNLGLGSAATRTALGTTGSLYSRDSILGSVSQTSGVPTGAVIEAGSNANGFFTKFADGTLICRVQRGMGTTNVASGAVYLTAAQTGSWPAAFSTTPTVVATTYGSTTAQCWAGEVNATTTGYTGAVAYSPVATATCNMTIVAIGRWF